MKMANKLPYNIICPNTEICSLYKEKAKYMKQKGLGELSHCDVINYDAKNHKYLCQMLHRLKAEDMDGRSIEGKVLLELPREAECAIVVNLNKKS